jgi:hypothetical protein
MKIIGATTFAAALILGSGSIALAQGSVTSSGTPTGCIQQPGTTGSTTGVSGDSARATGGGSGTAGAGGTAGASASAGNLGAAGRVSGDSAMATGGSGGGTASGAMGGASGRAAANPC